MAKIVLVRAQLSRITRVRQTASNLETVPLVVDTRTILDPRDPALIEAVAKASYEANPAYHGSNSDAARWLYEEIDDSNQAYWRVIGRAALKAMAEFGGKDG